MSEELSGYTMVKQRLPVWFDSLYSLMYTNIISN